MSRAIEIRPLPCSASGGSVTSSAELSFPEGDSFRLWYRLPERFAPMLSGDCDHFVLAALFPAMGRGADIVVHGRVSPSLLANLEEFVIAWGRWAPGRYSRVSIAAEEELEPAGPRPAAVVAAFSGGLDSAFSVRRHFLGGAGRRNLNISAGMLVHGFDIPVDDAAGFDGARRHAEAMLQSVGAELVPVATNLRGLRMHWLSAYGVALGSCLALLKGAFSTGMIAASCEYDRLSFEVGSSPVSDQFLSSDSMRVVHDGAEFSRYEKTPLLAGWTEAMEHLRVCFENRVPGENCGRCVKCVTTMLGFKAHGLPVPRAFPAEPGIAAILGLKAGHWSGLRRLREIPVFARRHGVHRTAWCRAVRLAALRNAWRIFRRKALERLVKRSPVRLFLKKLARGLAGQGGGSGDAGS